MKLLLALVVLTLSIGSALAAPREVSVPVEHIYIPYGFDSNDSTELMVTGYLPNLCYQKTSYSAKKVDASTILVDVKANYIDGACAEMIVSYTQKIELGLLGAGNYRILIKNGKSYHTSYLQVAQARARTKDDYLYANVTEVSNQFGSDLIRIKGFHPNDCYEIGQVSLVSNRTNAFSVLPILKKVKDDCRKVNVPFEYDFKVPETLAPEQLLIHVRTMNGNAKNIIYNRFNLY